MPDDTPASAVPARPDLPSKATLMGTVWTITVDPSLPGGEKTVYLFAEPQFIGRHYVLEDATMYIRRPTRQLWPPEEGASVKPLPRRVGCLLGLVAILTLLTALAALGWWARSF